MTVRLDHPAVGVAELVMDRPEALNAISTDQARRLTTACAELAGDRTVHAVVLSSALAKAFCVGADLKERAGFTDEQLAAQRPVMQAAFAAVLELPMPTIAAVEGYALGGGCELALACDLIVASESAVFGLPEVGVGLVPGGGGTQLLPRRIGANRAADLIYTARHVAVDEAWRLGLADRRVPEGDARAAALELAEAIAHQSPVALRNAKWALRRGTGVDLSSALVIEDQAWQRTAFSPDRVEGIAAFTDRRAPRWPGLPAES
ncbi:MAG: enoyl-CoA hydratase-related protein [Propionibacteriaceae bacterium]